MSAPQAPDGSVYPYSAAHMNLQFIAPPVSHPVHRLTMFCVGKGSAMDNCPHA